MVGKIPQHIFFLMKMYHKSTFNIQHIFIRSVKVRRKRSGAKWLEKSFPMSCFGGNNFLDSSWTRKIWRKKKFNISLPSSQLETLCQPHLLCRLDEPEKLGHGETRRPKGVVTLWPQEVTVTGLICTLDTSITGVPDILQGRQPTL